ncbi:MAG: NAD-dependent epimerase/dehydratase family protein [Proteobacteria bacterium]|nr:NAD-dependent epimerase/dehydratase family protein [Pseudomonadota bacterium]
MPVLVTGAAGFIGYHVSEALLARGERVVGLDNLSPYYDVALKQARLERLEGHSGFRFIRADISDRQAFGDALAGAADIDRVVHLAAQAGVRYSLDHPFVYAETNVVGHLVILEYCRALKNLRHLVYASSSSVYGANSELPFSVEDRVDHPVSLYAATKRTNELMSHSYAHLYGLPQTGLRFFTVYGPWGRPDMAIYIFTKAILAGRPIHLFNGGDMRRDFTYIDDIVQGVLAALDKPPQGAPGKPPHRLYNLGNSRVEPLTRVVELIEDLLGKKAAVINEPMQPGDVKETYADIAASERDLGFSPTTPLDVGLPKFVEWYRAHVESKPHAGTKG